MKSERADIIRDVLMEDGYESKDQVVDSFTIMIVLSKIDKYKSECAKYEKKYDCSLDALKSRIEKMEGEEEFEIEDDLMDWEFAENAKKLWQKRLEVLNSA
ncbi:MAG: hypothetical protein COS84_08505 [Armatimonadetes bacterium CG07_land_8_20_14_0_80_40_9]|nr:MAG: hypothetical protein COS84_08505 [Armatimonadetes bacterium CG07_land_8_20_14_0_80_40_9]